MKTEEIRVLAISLGNELKYIVKQDGGSEVQLFNVIPAKIGDFQDLLAPVTPPQVGKMGA